MGNKLRKLGRSEAEGENGKTAEASQNQPTAAAAAAETSTMGDKKVSVLCLLSGLMSGGPS